MASMSRPPNAMDKSKPVKRSHSLLVHSKPLVVLKQRASSLKREFSLKENRDPDKNSQLRSPLEMFRGQRSLHRRPKMRPVVDLGYERPSSPLLGFNNSPLQVRRRMKHAKSCDMAPLRMRMRMQQEEDQASTSSSESWNVASVELKQENENSSCQITQLNCSPTSHRKVWTLDRNSARLSPHDTTDSSTSTSRSQSPAGFDSLPFSGRPTPDLPLHSNMPDISVSEATPTLTPKNTLLRFPMMRACHSTSALYTKSSTHVTDRSEPILHELMKTEQRYISNLDTLLNTLLPLMEDTVAPRDLRLLFPCQLELLLDWHKQLLAQFEDRLNQNSAHYGMVGDVFRKMCSRETGNSEFFNMYSAYMNEFKVAMQTLAKYEQSSQTFRHAVRSCQQMAECDGLPLSAFLLTPVQRLPRYELLLKDLLKNTPVDHTDNYFLEEAIKLLHEELLRLNASIKSCELACSVSRIRNGRRSGSIRRLGTKGRQLARNLKKHLSTISVEDLSDNNRSRSEMSQPITAQKKTHSVQEMRGTGLYTSAENLALESIGEHENRRPFSTIGRTSSCINLAAEYEAHPERKRYSQPLCHLAVLESLPGTPEPSSPLPQSETDDTAAAQNTSRASIYSTTSSTSGIGSANSQVELDSTLTLTPSTPSSPHSPLPPPSTNSLEITPTNQPPPLPTTVSVATPHRPIIASSTTSTSTSSLAQRRWRKRISWAGSFVMPRIMSKKKTSAPDVATISKRSSRDISHPMDFRHIQHGFIATSTPEPVN